ncbi:MAG: hypothetical protein HYZ37_06310 [Candidatus Solibacter usitatus]|nr:hypothetical protein [Candidatus Solibacter usitatus]
MTTAPSGLSFSLTGAPHTNARSYPVTATITDPNYKGSASGTFLINQAPATVTFGNMTQTYTGGALSPTVTTAPSGLSFLLTGAPDTNVGSYPVTATINNPNYKGSATGPPPATVPAYLTVAVSSSITKSGSTLSGKIAQIVIVQTNAGYSSDPGPAGTGTIVARLCQ